jgi:hypothetical protein
MSERLEAHYQNRIYYFFVKEKKDGELWIEMYKTPYYFVKKDGVWQNHSSNKMNMIDPLIEIVAAAAGMP